MEWAHVITETMTGTKTWTVSGTTCITVFGHRIMLDEGTKTVGIEKGDNTQTRLQIDGNIDEVHPLTDSETRVSIVRLGEDGSLVGYGSFTVRIKIEDWGTVRFWGETHKLTNIKKRHVMCGANVSASKDALEILEPGYEFDVPAGSNKKLLELNCGTTLAYVRNTSRNYTFNVTVNKKNPKGSPVSAAPGNKETKRKRSSSKEEEEKEDEETTLDKQKKQKDDNQKSNLTDSIVDGVSIERTKNPVWARVFLDNILHANVTERDEHLRFGRFTGRIVYDEMKAHIEIEDHKPEALKYYINKFTLHDTQGTANLIVRLTVLADREPGPAFELNEEYEPRHIVLLPTKDTEQKSKVEIIESLSQRLTDLTRTQDETEKRVKYEQNLSLMATRQVLEISKMLDEMRKRNEMDRRSYQEHVELDRRAYKEHADSVQEMITTINKNHKNTVDQLTKENSQLAKENNDLRQRLPKDIKDMDVSALVKYQKELSVITAEVQQGILSASANLCIVCCEGPKEILFKPCTHAIVCSKCSPKLDKCPNCRSVIAERQRFFL